MVPDNDPGPRSGMGDGQGFSQQPQPPRRPGFLEYLRRTQSGPAGFRRVVAGISLLVLGVLMVGAGLLGAASRPSAARQRFQPPREVVYSQFLNLVNDGHVRAVRFDDAAARIYFDTHHAQPGAAASLEGASSSSSSASTSTAGAAAANVGTTKAEAWSPPSAAAAASQARRASAKGPRQFYTKRIADPTLVARLAKSGVEFGAMQASATSFLARSFGTMLALWLPLLPLYFLMKRVLDGRMGGKRKRGGTQARRPPVTFADVAGVQSAKEELMETVACLRDARRYARLNASMPSGVLLCGPPGTGKTLLAKAVAGEAGVPFFSASASEFVEMFVGRGAARVRELFREARERAPSVVFIDELDAIGGRRGVSMNEERDQTLNQLLTELDGFEGRPGVLLLAATNRPEMLDPALTRPGRLSRKVIVPLPDERGRAEILAVHLRKVPMESTQLKAAMCEEIARITAGFSGAELANVVNEAALLAGRGGADYISPRDLVEGVQRTRYGVNGGGAGGALLPAGWGGGTIQRRLTDWLAESVARRASDAAAAAAPRAASGSG